ncbi:TetR family transcriptional regulator [Kitasatospora phosalacinea]|uniref:TetR family transcriptional regulator n=1 Tax=Kitasatospora phosalacinea TaxID=2065 RepID=A0A9W6Q558_9ACTN|nr:TetR/AcrR family transcriptional regulator [Kitasatospora phosalacinea]GLW70049.1 TetR family transcriptional regulator [Kitasatospora phosalacinea]
MVQRRPVVRRPPGRRARILAVAAARFHRDGYHRVSMAEIAAEVGITAPALYRHFRNKSELLLRAVESGLHAVCAATASGGAVELAELALERREFGTLWQRDARLLPPGQRAVLRRQLRAAVRESAGEEGELARWAVLSAYGSLSHHGVVLPRRRYLELLGGMRERLLAVREFGAAVVPGRSGSPGPPGPPGPSVSEGVGRRDALVAAATRLFHRRGFDNVSMEQLGAAVGIAGPSVYKHFGTKSALLAAVLDRGREQLRREVLPVLAAGPAPAVAAFAAFAWRERDYLGVMLSETERLAPGERRAAVDFRREFLRAWVEHTSMPGEPSAEARVRVHAMIAVAIDTARSGAGTPAAVAAYAAAALGGVVREG